MKLSKHISRKKGFTLIELLIVIGIIAVLAAGLLAVLDPIDQLRRGRDSTRRGATVEITNALNRYYASSQQFPWGTQSTGPVNITAMVFGGVIGTLTNSNEIKTNFMAGIPTGRAIYLYTDTDQNVYTCFQQEARAPNVADVYLSQAAWPYQTGSSCVAPSGGTACWFCAR